MKKIFFLLSIFATVNSSAALLITGNLMTNDSITIGDGTTYALVSYSYQSDGSIDAYLSFWKNRNSYVKKNKESFTQSGSGLIANFRSSYTIPDDTLATAPDKFFLSLDGKTIFDKFQIWLEGKISEMIIRDNESFKIQIVDIKK